MEKLELDLSQLFSDTAKLSELDSYVEQSLQMVGEGNEVILTGAAPVWLYL